MNASTLIYTALSPLVAGQVYPHLIPETADDTPPYIIYQIVSTLPITTLDGITHHERVRVQIDVYHDDYDGLLALYGQVLDKFDQLPMSEHDGTHFSVDEGLYRASIDVFFNHQTKPNQPNEE